MRIEVLKKYIILSLTAGFGGLFVAWIGSILLIDSFAYLTIYSFFIFTKDLFKYLLQYEINYPPNDDEFFNYRQISYGLNWSEGLITYTLYLLGIYVIAFIYQQRSQNRLTIEPSFLALGGAIGFLLGSQLSHGRYIVDALFYFLLWTFSRPSIENLGYLLPFVVSLLGICLACVLKTRKHNTHALAWLLRLVIPITALYLLIILPSGNFPGVAASPEVRQKWAYKEFSDYGKIVNAIQSCKPIHKRVGTVKIVAPTQGKNYTFYDYGSSGHRGEMTLEVIGDQSTGVLNFQFHIETNLGQGKFTSSDKNEILSCPYSG